ncbi:hypothetical protein Terro_4385 [Terriglobus roseus DSM 18391]|uniref:Ligand-binding SRPBCC domain-containing protein n=1 Tax=Terriglobus roseus (strain DSM 18391 / NRRL B-41598 / KBS 63) TaxID=926566 RepID=I3ZMW4_TERRK|nr:hypothetical protein [Terriglobus roseus]AFL90582.1 hypothetical protein Terro_4385 [Terriglobus roseus DSM 18391]
MAEWTQDGDTFTLRDTAVVKAPIDRCFQLTCCIALVREELGMKPVTGRTEGLVQHGDEVRWEGWQLGLKHYHVTGISGYERPVFMQDSMLDGRFRTFQHDHHLRELPNDAGTELQDEVRFSLPFGFVGRLVARYVMVPHILRLLRSRFARIRRIAEGDAWRQYLPDEQTASHA